MRALRTTVLSLLLLVPLAAPVRADGPVDTAGHQVRALRAEADAATARLVAGTQRLADEQSRLAQVQRSAASARRDATAAEGRVAQSRARLDALVAAAWRDAAPDDVALAVADGPAALQDALVARADLAHVRGDEQALLRSATADRVRAGALVLAATDLEAQAATSRRAVADQVASLRSLADATRTELEAADARLREAQAAQARAAAEASGGGVAGVALRGAADGGSCAGAPTAGSPNGFLPTSSLCPIGGGGMLRADAARAFLRMAAARPQCVTDSYRSYARQVSVFARKPELAAVPGTSNHGLGVAVDLGCGAERFGSDAFLWLKANAGRYGWVHPAWAEPGGVRPEPWHWEYVG